MTLSLNTLEPKTAVISMILSFSLFLFSKRQGLSVLGGEECGSIDPLGTGPDDERRRDDRKHVLLGRDGAVRDSCRIVYVGLAADIPETLPVKPADGPLASCRAKVRQ
jgi:hypothetical protein